MDIATTYTGMMSFRTQEEILSETHHELINRLQRLIDAQLSDIVKNEPYAILDFPDIKNVGDSAIWLGEIAYFRKQLNFDPAYVSTMADFSTSRLEKRVGEGPIFIHGGGNFGDIWQAHQHFREEILRRFPKRRVIQLPQSIHYNSPARVEETARAIEKHGNFILMVRDEESKDFATKHFNCDVRLCPDMAFYIGPLVPEVSEIPLLAMLRADKEKQCEYDLTSFPHLPVEDWISEPSFEMKLVKLRAYLKKRLTGKSRQNAIFAKYHSAAEARFHRGFKQLSRGESIVTDRLHVHIICLLLGIPHSTLDNNYGKIGRFMSAFSGTTDLTYRATSIFAAIEWATLQTRT